MNFADWERAAALYLPLTAAVIARLVHGKIPRQFAACLLGTLWAVPSLLAVQKMNQFAWWWNFPGAATLRVCDMPLELFLGWIILWGLLPQLLFQQLGILASTAIMVLLDCLLMPLCTATIQLNPHWLIGELVAVLLVLLPSRAIAHWTQSNTHLRSRVFLQTSPSVDALPLPRPRAVLRASPSSIQLRLDGTPPHAWLGAATGLPTRLSPGSSWHQCCDGVRTARRRNPYPLDPPQRLVTSGIYRYLANPMQLSCTLVFLIWGGLLHSGWVILGGGIAIAYSAGIAEWDQAQDLRKRFGQPWQTYRAAVHNWNPLWRPYHAGLPATLYIAKHASRAASFARGLKLESQSACRSSTPKLCQRIRFEECAMTPGMARRQSMV